MTARGVCSLMHPPVQKSHRLKESMHVKTKMSERLIPLFLSLFSHPSIHPGSRLPPSFVPHLPLTFPLTLIQRPSATECRISARAHGRRPEGGRWRTVPRFRRHFTSWHQNLPRQETQNNRAEPTASSFIQHSSSILLLLGVYAV